MASISLCMIVRDEESVLGRCLDSVKDAVDEIIIVDTGSKDRTAQIASGYTDQLYHFTWRDDFAAARNFAFSKANCDYQMWLDADDVVEDADALLRLKADLTEDVVMLPYHVAFDAQGNPTMTYYRERLLRRERQFRWVGAVHEAITPAGTIRYGDAAILHRKLHINDPDRNLRILEGIFANGGDVSPRDRYYYARELFAHERIAEAEAQIRTFLSEDGWKEDRINACLLLSQCCQAMHRTGDALRALFASFSEDLPRAEICCEIGSILIREARYKEAVFWYQCAVAAPAAVHGFRNPDCHDYIPYMQLCVCYDRLGNKVLASAYNDKAGRIKPHDAAFLANQAYFQQLLSL